jgi:two-component system LytT family response regulator
MPEIRALIVDDEPLGRRGVRQMLARHPDVVVVAEARDGREALRALEVHSPDLVFLDVQMPELDGFEVVRVRGPERMPPVIFVTAYDEFALRAFEVSALDYLMKPLNEHRFDAALGRARRRIREADALALSRQLAALVGFKDVQEKRAGPACSLTVRTRTGTLVLDARDIDWVEAEDYYAAVHAGGGRYLVRESLGALEQRLDPAVFVRVHRSALVNIDRIRELRAPAGETASVVLRDDTCIPVSRRRYTKVEALLRSGT